MHYPVVHNSGPSSTIEDCTPPSLSLGKRGFLAALAATALAISLYLTWVSFTSGSVVGCGGELVDCDEVLASRWAKWLNVPVGVLAAATFGSLLAAVWFLGATTPLAVRRLAWTVVLALATVAALAALWFIGLQMFAVGKFCVPCLVTHFCGITFASAAWCFARGGRHLGTLRNAAGGAALVCSAALTLGQLLYEPERFQLTRYDEQPLEPETRESQSSSESDNAVATSKGPTKVTAQKPKVSRLIKLPGSKQVIDAYEHPIIGSPDAERAIVKLFDYTCKTCRKVHHQLEDARRHYGDRVAIIVLPVPLNAACNSHARSAEGSPHEKACVYARLALAVWRADRTKFAQFHHWILAPQTPPSPEEARKYAIDLVGDGPFRTAYDDWRLSEQLRVYTDLYGELGAGQIPKLLLESIKLEGEYASSKRLIEILDSEWQRK